MGLDPEYTPLSFAVDLDEGTDSLSLKLQNVRIGHLSDTYSTQIGGIM